MLRFDNMCVDEPEAKIEMMVKRIELLLEKFRVYYNAVSPNYYVNRGLLEMKSSIRFLWEDYKVYGTPVQLNHLAIDIRNERVKADNCGDKMRGLALEGVLLQLKEMTDNLDKVKPCKN